MLGKNAVSAARVQNNCDAAAPAGGTAEYAKLVELLMHAYPDTKLVAVGFSMGGNVVCKYLGEDERNQQHFICAISCCQGYDAYE